MSPRTIDVRSYFLVTVILVFLMSTAHGAILTEDIQNLIRRANTIHTLDFQVSGSGGITQHKRAFDGDLATATTLNSSGAPEGYVECSFIDSQHRFVQPFPVSDIFVKLEIVGESDGATEFVRESGANFRLEYKTTEDDDWQILDEIQRLCRHSDVGEVTCRIGPERLEYRDLGLLGVTDVRAFLNGTGHRAGGDGYSRSNVRLFEIQVLPEPATVLLLCALGPVLLSRSRARRDSRRRCHAEAGSR